MSDKIKIWDAGDTTEPLSLVSTPLDSKTHTAKPGAMIVPHASLFTPLELACAAISAFLAKAGFIYKEGSYSREGYKLEFSPVTDNSKVAHCASGSVQKLNKHVKDPTVMVIGSRSSNMKVTYASYPAELMLPGVETYSAVLVIFTSIAICMDSLLRELGDPFPALNPPPRFLEELKLPGLADPAVAEAAAAIENS